MWFLLWDYSVGGYTSNGGGDYETTLCGYTVICSVNDMTEMWGYNMCDFSVWLKYDQVITVSTYVTHNLHY